MADRNDLPPEPVPSPDDSVPARPPDPVPAAAPPRYNANVQLIRRRLADEDRMKVKRRWKFL